MEAVVRTRAVVAIGRRVPLAILGARAREAGEAGLGITHLRVPPLAPVAAALTQRRRVLRMAEAIGHLRERTVGQRVLQRCRAATT
ncbi:hypothetical protein G6F46_015433 [Rhizopus delemar]|nr:hypothetical protein G6F46_015433 [Rhizopus delemar]